MSQIAIGNLTIQYERNHDIMHSMGRIVVIVDRVGFQALVPTPPTPATIAAALFDLACEVEKYAAKIPQS